MPPHAVRVSELAGREAEAIYRRLGKTMTLEAAAEWQAGLYESFASLATLPERCLEAPENRFYQKKRPGPVLRVFLYRWGRSVWRILFTVHTATADDPASVIVRLIRSAAQKPMTRWPPE